MNFGASYENKKKPNKSNTEERSIPVTPMSFSPWSVANYPLVHLTCIVFLIIIIYSNTLNAPFQGDESQFIVDNLIVKNLHYFTHPSDAKGVEFYSAFVNRYVGYLTFALNYRIHGLSITGYHIVNIAIHIANALLVYLLVLLSFRTPFMESSSIKYHSRYIALFSSLFFAAHPLQTEAVTYVFQRLASLVAFFCLISLTAYAQSRMAENRWQRVFFYSISFISAVLAMKTKENAFALPVVITLVEFCFFADSIKKRMLFLTPILLTLSIVPLTLMSITNAYQLAPDAHRMKVYSQEDYFFTQFRVIVTYLRLLFFPVNQNFFGDYHVFRSFFDLPIILSFLFLSALFSLGLYLIRGNRRWVNNSSPFRLVGFGILFFFITLSVESSIIPIPLLINEYRMYLPSVGLIICIVTGAFLVFSRFTSRVSRPLIVLIVSIIGVLSVTTYLRNEVWRDGISLWEDTARKSPAVARVNFRLGKAYQDRNMIDKAIEQYLIVIKLEPDYVNAYINLANIYNHFNMPDKAIEQYLIAIKLRPDSPETHYNLGVVYQSLNMLDKARQQYILAVELKPDFIQARNNLGFVYYGLNMPDKAIRELEAAINLEPSEPEAHFNLGLVYYRIGQVENARRELIIGLKIKPDEQKAQQLLREVSR